MASTVITLLCSLSIIHAESIVCRKGEGNGACLAKKVRKMPWSNENSTTAPTPKNISYNIVRTEKEYYINVTWTQKRKDMENVEGYLMEVTSDQTHMHYQFTLNKERLREHYVKQEPYISFCFDGVFLFPYYTIVTLYSMPVYKYSDENHHIELHVHYDPFAEDVIESNSVDKIHLKSETTTSDPTTTDHKTAKDGSPNPNLSSHILACAVTAICTALLIGIATLAYKSCKKSTHLKGRLKFEYSERTGEGAKAKVLIVTSMSDEEHNNGEEFYRKAALCIKSTLERFDQYKVSCNLLTVTEVSNKGVAIWAHELIKTHDKIVVMCSPSLVANANEHLMNTVHSERMAYKDASLQILQSFITNTHLSDAKLILACVDDPPHKCLVNTRINALINCKCVNLIYEFPKFIDVLSPKGSYLAGSKIALMWSDFRQMLERNRSEYSQMQPMDFKKCTSTHLTSNKLSHETQYDSVYSSRCNSHSTESISSHEDTGFHECNQEKNCCNEHYSNLGARPKMPIY